MLKVLADKHLYFLKEYIPAKVHLKTFDPAEGIPVTHGYDALFVRTVSKVNRLTIPDPSSLSFVATGSSGSDHIDEAYLQDHGITVADAKGCNARAVAEYVITSILLWTEKNNVKADTLTIGVVGAGAVGSAVVKMAETLGWKFKAYDPPREKRDPSFVSCGLQEVLECDAVSLHVPFVTNGEYPTVYWLDQDKINKGSFRLVVNAARGMVTEEKALLDWKQHAPQRALITDVWENEPLFDPDFARYSFIATPHIAGYSEQSKKDATRMIVDQFCSYFGIETSPVYEKAFIDHNPERSEVYGSLSEVLSDLHPVTRYDRQLRSFISDANRGKHFQRLRTEGTYRFEYAHIRIPAFLFQRFPILEPLGLQPES